VPLVLLGLLAAGAGAAGAWWANDALERQGLKAPGQLEPGAAWRAAGAGIGAGLVAAGALVYLVGRVR